MSTITGINNSLMSSMLQGMQSRPDPSQKFKELNSDSSGGLDKTELSTMAKELSKMTGKTLNVDDAIKTYDTNNDGQLNQNEMDTMMKKTMGPPTSNGSSMQQVMEAYQKNSGDDQMSSLLNMLDQSSSSSATSGTSTSSSSDDTMSILLNMLDQSSSSSATSGTSTSSSSDDTMSMLLNMIDKLASSSSASSSTPNRDEMFKKLDSDGSGGLNQSELDVMAKNISSMTGQTIDTKNAISTYDANGDGIEALRQILKAAPATKVLMLSSHTANPAWARASTRPRSTKLTSTSRRYSCRLRERTRPTVICAAWRRLAPVAN